jgi:hypothetical protein
MTRPAKKRYARWRPTGPNRTTQIKFLASDEERDRWFKAAHKANQDLSAWLRALADAASQ